MKEQKLGAGISVQGFSSMEELLEHQAQQETQAIREAMPEQWEIGFGSYVFRLVDQLPIFGHIFTKAAFFEDNLLGDADHDEEIRAEWEGIEDAHRRGYRYGKWYSNVLLEGEYGSAHVVTLWEITQQDFERARLVSWEVWAELAQSLSQQIMAARTRNRRGKE